MKYDLPIGTGYKKPNKTETVTKLQKQILDECYDNNTGPLFFAEHCAWVKCNGLTRYQPFDYQREMLFTMHNEQNACSMFSRQLGKCVYFQSLTRVRNKKTGEILEIPIGEFFELAKK